ncbi:MAG: tetratricopeptide repeat protein [Gemmataceae bacterium]
MDLHNQSDPLADLLARGRYPQALPLAQAAVDRLPDDAPAAARAAALETLGVVLRELGEYARAEGPLLQALSARGGAGKESPAYARTLTELGRLYEEQARYANAEKLFRSALELCEQAGGPDHLDVADRLYDLGKLLDHLGRFDEATACHDRARAIHQAHGVDRPEYALSLAAGAWADWRRGRLEQAAEAVRTATALLARTRGEDHPDYATCCQFLSRICLHQARIDEAESLADKVLAVRRARLGERHHRYGGALENLALIRTLQGRADEATALARQGLEITRQALGERHPFVADGLAALAYALQAAGHPDEAEVQAREALAVCEAALGADHPHLANCHRDLAEAVAAQHRTDEADTHYLRALDILRPYGPTCRVEIIETLQGRARLLAVCNRPDEAVAAAAAGGCPGARPEPTAVVRCCWRAGWTAWRACTRRSASWPRRSRSGARC